MNISFIDRLKKTFEKNSLTILSLLFTVTLGVTLFIMSTFSRNTSTRTSTDTAKVSNFLYTIKQTEGTDNTLVANNNATINIFDTATDTGLYDKENELDKIIAPGTAGYFEFQYVNSSQTPVKVTFDTLGYSGTTKINNKNHAIPIIFYFNGLYYSDLYNQSLTDYDGDSKNTTGKDYLYYFNVGNAESNTNGITLAGDMTNFLTALNNYQTMSTTPEDKALSFLNLVQGAGEQNTNMDYTRIAWFYPFEARIKKSNGTPDEEGTNINSNYNIYAFDAYNTAISDGETNNMPSVTMTPILRVSQIDVYQNFTKNQNYGFDSSKWYKFEGTDNAVVRWGVD